jgi:hypothetical protein
MTEIFTALPVARLTSVPTLEALRLNGIRAEIDCAVFLGLPELVQLTVLKDVKALFKAREFAHLDIDYS